MRGWAASSAAAEKYCATTRSKNRDARLTDRDDVDVAADRANELGHEVDVVVEIELSGPTHRHEARVDPVRHVDVVIGEQLADRLPEEGREVPRERGDDEDARVGAVFGAGEANKAAEWRLENGLLEDRDGAPVDARRRQSKRGLVVPPGRAFQQLGCGNHRSSAGQLRPGGANGARPQVDGLGEGSIELEGLVSEGHDGNVADTRWSFQSSCVHVHKFRARVECW